MTIIRIEATDGWMSPKGDFYPCYINKYEQHHSINSSLNNHEATAFYILIEVLGDEPLPDVPNDFIYAEATYTLLSYGWMRVDIESILINQRATEYQLQTLETMLQMDDKWDGFCRKCAIKLISNNGHIIDSWY